MSEAVTVSNGYGQFHLARLAENLNRQDMLSSFFTGAYVSSRAAKALSRVSTSAGQTRLLERRIDVPDSIVRSYWPGEFPHQIAQRLRTRGDERASDYFVARSMDGYAKWVARRLKAQRRSGGIYHFRAGMGGASISAARQLGMTILCDHSIAHPRLLPGLIDGTNGTASHLNALWSRVENDMKNADGIVVNSDFVAATCVEMGIDPQRVFVAYTGVDPVFIANVDRSKPKNRFERVKVLFAGTLEKRKGIDTVVAAATMFEPDQVDWALVGSWQTNAAETQSKTPTWVEQIARLPRAELAARLANSNVFVFPSRAEGSARVVAEALAAGCFVITTAESGSVTRDGVDGVLVRPGDHEAIYAAIAMYMKMPLAIRESRSLATATFAREKLSEHSYTGSVRNAYELVRRT